MKRGRNAYTPGQRPLRGHTNEFPKGKGGVVFCKVCNIVYFKKSWHHNLRRHKNLHEDLAVAFVVCPACAMIQNGKYEGRVVLTNMPPLVRENLENLIHAFTHRAYQRDPLDRLIAIKKQNATFEITTTENQLAAKLAKKIKDVYKKVRVNVSYGHAKDKASEITIAFLS
ncbi:hypothetical protein HY250_01425 [Candidatus Azambacteria bacterium]|nr:hypothetical protein [Candidatus Azambacteria bacterium]